MNPTLDLIHNHKSIRKFTGQPIAPEQLDAIFQAAQAASSSSFLQAGSVIRVTDQAKRAKLVELTGGQPWVGSAAEFLVWCADFHRHQQVAPEAKLGYTEQLLIGAIDTALMAENALVAAESLGLGGVFIGGIRNHPDEVVKLLGLPRQVIPLFGMCLGHPDQAPSLRPRLPQALVVHENSYQQELDRALLAKYDEQVRRYYQTRPGSAKVMTWSEQVAATLKKESRPHIRAFLESQGFIQK
ncbi:oxygen-insensitive NADPH nitroreductase [Gallaecimonas kandeliae]|uniref:oxygen-insensitive NADPH nitroreductase n=1 Tax=Gallaecimonas kandeliae TaxID=3029055 RepID=UPI0026478230|nr:oxygen-insensitive NADPH nitroreductase [Gallaecimonas kandeliae]WKE65772.1 oxygen-insensitive NADPH nitroreductase [Gallaecimonas kandeliae]